MPATACLPAQLNDRPRQGGIPRGQFAKRIEVPTQKTDFSRIGFGTVPKSEHQPARRVALLEFLAAAIGEPKYVTGFRWFGIAWAYHSLQRANAAS
jgi:hypothetical protein